MMTFALLMGKMMGKVGSWFHRGTALPGKVALALDRHLLAKLQGPETVILVTGTNGKTSTTRYLAAFFAKAGRKVVTNAEGANMAQGIVSCLLRDANMKGESRSDVAVLEVDEGFLGQVAWEYPPDLVVFTNLFQDQVDRFGSPILLADRMASQKLPAETQILYNADDPILAGLARRLDNPAFAYGMIPWESGRGQTEPCPLCGQPLIYDLFYYDHLGHYGCTCGFEHPHLDYEGVENEDGSFTIEGQVYPASPDPLYSRYNRLAAIACGLHEGLDPLFMETALQDMEGQNGRLERFTCNGRPSFLNLVKNPAGANASLAFILKEAGSEPFDLYFAANNEAADGRDGSWLQAVNFEQLRGSGLRQVFVSGSLAPALREILKKKLPGVPVHAMKAQAALAELFVRGNRCFFLANFTCLGPTRQALVRAGLLK